MKRDNESNIRQIRDRGDMAAMLVFVFKSIGDAENQPWFAPVIHPKK